MIVPISIVIPFTRKDDEVFLWTQIRESDDDLAGKIEFPGGKIEANENPILAGVREVKEEVGLDIDEKLVEKFKSYNFDLGEKRILLMVHLYEDDKSVFNQQGYIKLEDFEQLKDKIPPANIGIIADLSEFLR